MMDDINKKANAIDDEFTRLTIVSSLKNLTDDDIKFLSTYSPPKERGFMWDDNERVDDIKNRICLANKGHSGTSLAFTLRWLESVCKKNIKRPLSNGTLVRS